MKILDPTKLPLQPMAGEEALNKAHADIREKQSKELINPLVAERALEQVRDQERTLNDRVVDCAARLEAFREDLPKEQQRLSALQDAIAMLKESAAREDRAEVLELEGKLPQVEDYILRLERAIKAAENSLKSYKILLAKLREEYKTPLLKEGIRREKMRATLHAVRKSLR
jgi:signal transduction histidine kinase